MISQVLPHPVGNALNIHFEPAADAVMSTVLRNTTGTFSGYNDPTATPVYTGSEGTYLIDHENLDNGTTYYYGQFDFDGTTWTAANVVSAVPASTYVDQSVDVLNLVRSRIDYGIKNEIALKTLTPPSGVIPVLNAPPVFDNTPWPTISVHVATDGPGERAIGEMTDTDVFDPSSQSYIEGQGWLSDVTLTIVGWTQNSDERIALRMAIRKIILGNLGIFDAAGLLLVSLSMQDVDDLSSYPAPVYEAVGTFSCKAPASVGDSVGPLTTSPTISITPSTPIFS